MPIVVVVAESKETPSRSLGKRLAADGCRVLHAADGAELHEVLSAMKADLIILSHSFGQAGGLAALQELRTHPKQAEVPVIVYSPLPLDGWADAAAKLGAAACLEMGSDFLDRVSQAAQRHARRATGRADASEPGGGAGSPHNGREKLP